MLVCQRVDCLDVRMSDSVIFHPFNKFLHVYGDTGICEALTRPKPRLVLDLVRSRYVYLPMGYSVYIYLCLSENWVPEKPISPGITMFSGNCLQKLPWNGELVPSSMSLAKKKVSPGEMSSVKRNPWMTHAHARNVQPRQPRQLTR